jgi:hypothetical protein
MRLSQFVRLNQAAGKISAPKSVKQKKPGMVRVPGYGLLSAEPGDQDDTFPPAIASYEVVDGWLVYKGRNGSEGVIIGPQKDLDQWAADVAKYLQMKPIQEEGAVDWNPSHGGERYVKDALSAAKKAAQLLGTGSIKVKPIVDSGRQQEGQAGDPILLINVHEGGTVEFYGPLRGIKIPSGMHTAAHEVAHHAFSKKSTKGRAAMNALKDWVKSNGSWLTLYHSLSGSHHEGLMELASLYVNEGAKLKAKAPELHKIIEDWIK